MYIFRIVHNILIDNLEEALNKHAPLGWELETILQVPNHPGYYILLKKPMNPTLDYFQGNTDEEIETEDFTTSPKANSKLQLPEGKDTRTTKQRRSPGVRPVGKRTTSRSKGK